MKRTFISAATLSLALTVCNNADSNATPADTSMTQTTPVPETMPPAAGGVVALGMTEAQLTDADLLDGAGKDLGDVEGLVRDAAGQVTHLIVEIDNTTPDRYVQIPITGLRLVERGNDRDIGSTLTRDQLMALPEVPNPETGATTASAVTSTSAPSTPPAK